MIAGALGLAAALFLAGALGPLRSDPSSGTTVSAGTNAGLLRPLADGSDLDQTISVLQTRLEEDSEDATGYASLGLAYLQKNRITADPAFYSKAETALSRSLDLDGTGNFEASLGMGILEASRHEFSSALEWGQQAESANPFNADARGVIVDALVELGRYDRAGRELQKMIDLKPNVASYSRVSYFRQLHGDSTGAVRLMKLAQDAAGTSSADAAWTSYQLGELYLSSGDVAQAEHEFERGAFFGPDAALPKVGLAKVAAARGQLGKATQILNRVVDAYPSPEFVTLLGDLYAAQDKRSLAASQYDLVSAMAELYERNGASTDLEMALFKADRQVDLKSAVRKAAAEYERRPSIHAADAFAWTLYATGSYERARALSQESLRLGTRSALFRFHAGMIAWANGDETGARLHLKTALEIDSHFSVLHVPTAEKTLRKLEPSS